MFPNCLATSVFPVPGGPYSSTPRTCCSFNLLAMFASTILDANTRLNMFANSLSNPPTPCSTNELPSRIIRARCACELCFSLSSCSGTVFAFPAAGPVFASVGVIPGGAAPRIALFGFGFSNFRGVGASVVASTSKSSARHCTRRFCVASAVVAAPSTSRRAAVR